MEWRCSKAEGHSVFCNSDVLCMVLSVMHALLHFSLGTAAPLLEEETVAQKVQPLPPLTPRMWPQRHAAKVQSLGFNATLELRETLWSSCNSTAMVRMGCPG